MTDDRHRPRRAVLYVPASKPRAMRKALALDADAIIFDLEDAVAPGEKPAARDALRELLSDAGNVGKEIVIRVNPLAGEWGGGDLAAAAELGCDAVLLPKVDAPRDVLDATDALRALDAPPQTKLWAMIETPKAVLNIGEIAELGRDAASRLDCFVVGTNDLVLETGVSAGAERAFLMPWLMQIVLAARAGGLDVLDGVYNDFRDMAGFEAECAQARAMGFDGKTLIHPDQLAPATHAFSPGADEVVAARAVVDAFSRPENAGKGVLSLDGRMVERLHLEQARRLLARAG